MKTKFILTAMCLPLAFAACTNEDLVIENQNSVEDRPVVDFKLAATYGADGAESRMVNNNGTFLWEGTDVLGASLVLAPATENKIYSNYKFVNELEAASSQVEFTTEATTVVGEYMFYYPYNKTMTKDLTGIRYALKEPQVYDPTGEEMMKNNFMIAPRVQVDGNEPGELTLPITMRSIYAYGQLNLNLAEYLQVNGTIVSATSVNVQKIILSYASKTHKDGIINQNTIPSVDIRANSLKTLRETVNGTYYGKSDAEIRAALLANADKVLTAQGTNPLLALTTEDDNTADGTIGQVSISCVSEAYPNGIALNKGGEFSTRVLLPTQEDAVITIYVYTNIGVFDVTTGQTDVLPNHKTILRQAGSIKDVITMGQFDSANSVNAISEADFIASMTQFNGLGNVTVPVTVGNFDLTAAAIAAIPSNVTVKFQSGVKFSGNMTLNKMMFNDATEITLKSGEIILGSDLCTYKETVAGSSVTTTLDGAPTIKITGADVTLTKNTLTYANVNVAGGKLTISATNASAEAVSATFASVNVTENGTLNVNKGLNTVTVTKGTLNNAAGSTIASVTVAANGTVENNGTITALSNAGTVNNYGTIAGGTNAKTINQKAASSKLTLSSNAVTGTINTVAYSQTTVTKAAQGAANPNNQGDINFVLNARVSADGNVTYQAPTDIVATSFAELPTAITKIVFNADFNYTHSTVNNATAATTGAVLPANVKTLQFKGNLKLSQDWALNAGSTIYFSAAAANINGAKTLSNVETIKAGVDLDGTANDVATDLYIATNTKITGVKYVVLNANASVWNDGSVTKDGTYSITGGTWGGNAIN